MSLGIVHRAVKFFECPRVLKSCFNDYVLSNLECYVPFVDVVCGVAFEFTR